MSLTDRGEWKLYTIYCRQHNQYPSLPDFVQWLQENNIQIQWNLPLELLNYKRDSNITKKSAQTRLQNQMETLL